MKVDFAAKIADLKGTVLKYEGADATLGDICTAALLATFNGEDATGETKDRRFRIAKKIEGGALSLSAEEVSEIKTLIGKMFPPIVVGRSYELLDPIE